MTIAALGQTPCGRGWLAAVVLLAPTVVASQTFTDRFSSAGLSRDEATQGIALADFDGDGAPDIFATSLFVDLPFPFPDLGSRNRLYLNSGSGIFSDQAPARRLDDDGQGQGAAMADYDNDGDADLYVVRGVQSAFAQPHRLYRQDSGVFDAAPSAFVSAAAAGRSVCWADYDRDGLVDVLVTNGLDSDVLPDARVFLFRNDGGGGFVDETIAVGIADTRNGQACAWSDYDNDGDMDVYIANKGFEDPVLGYTDPQANALYKNLLVESGVATFVDVAVAAGVTGLDAIDPAGSALGCNWADFDDDGWMDLFVTNGFAGIIPTPIDTPNRLFRNNGDGTFADQTIRFGLSLSLLPTFGSTWGDFDNDMDLDVYIANADIPLLVPARTELAVNSGPPFHTFRNVAAAAGVEVQQFATACATADFNRDGWLDIYSVNGTPGVELLFEVADNLWVNNGGSNHWLHLDLVGTDSNRSAIGARVRVTANGRSMTREVAAGSGFQSMDDLRVEFGLGSNLQAEEVEIRWPSGCIQRLTDVLADQVVVVVEQCAERILRRELMTPRAGMFPLPDYAIAPGVPLWDDPAAPVPDGLSYFYQHASPVEILLVKMTSTVRMSW